jgi:alpha-L-fucosidase
MPEKNTDWFMRCGWGVMTHYLSSPAGSLPGPYISVDQWNRDIDGFDARGLASQLEETGAGYFFITVGQNTGYYLSPNETYDSITGRRPGGCSKRDLVADLADELAGKNIKLMVYIPASAPVFDRQACESLKFAPAWPDRDPLWCELKIGDVKPIPGVDSRLSQFQRNWEAVITEWSLRWGEKVAGWWVDGCYHPDLMYNFPDEPNYTSFIRALKAGNPGRIVGFNPGWPHSPAHSATELEDFLAGHDPGECLNICEGRRINGVQWHALCRAATLWGGGSPRFCPEMMIGYTKEVISKGGVVTWDTPANKKGLFPDEFRRLLVTMGAALKKLKQSGGTEIC